MAAVAIVLTGTAAGTASKIRATVIPTGSLSWKHKADASLGQNYPVLYGVGNCLINSTNNQTKTLI